jgi:hypothetical protein
MSIIKSIKDTISPPPTEEQTREKEIMKRFGLKKDTRVPHRYWIDDRRAINFNPGSPVSCEKAIRKLEEMFDNPEIETMPKENREYNPFTKKDQQGEGWLGKLESATRNVSKETDREFREEMGGFDPKAIEKELLSTGGAKYDPVTYKDYLGDVPGGKKKKRGKGGASSDPFFD